MLAAGRALRRVAVCRAACRLTRRCRAPVGCRRARQCGCCNGPHYSCAKRSQGDLAMPTSDARIGFLTVAEVADQLRVSTMTVYRLIKAGDLVAARIGRSYRLRP